MRARESRGARGERERAANGEGAEGRAAKALILASASPRRSKILKALGWRIRVIPSGLPEEGIPHEDPVKAATILALHKAREVAIRLRKGMVLGADTVVHLDGRIMGKPRDAE